MLKNSVKPPYAPFTWDDSYLVSPIFPEYPKTPSFPPVRPGKKTLKHTNPPPKGQFLHPTKVL